MKKLLLISSSRKGNLGYLEHTLEPARRLLKGRINQALFAPYAALTRSFDAYAAAVRYAYAQMNIEIVSIHDFADARQALNKADALIVGGGNTFALLNRLYAHGLVEAIRDLVRDGLPYLGWSAGANVACPTIRTTNDMPVLEPPALSALGLIPFQINPHFISGKPAGHHGESREERLAEFLAANPGQNVLALPEGSALYVQGENATLLGDMDALIFRQSGRRESLAPGAEFPLSYVNS